MPFKFNAITGELDLVNPGSSGGVTDGDKGDITVSSSGTVWTADQTLIMGKPTVNADGADFVLFADASDSNKLKYSTVDWFGPNIQTAGGSIARRPILNFVAPLMAVDDYGNGRINISTSGNAAAGNQGDFQWNDAGTLAGDMLLSTDGTYVYMGNTFYTGITDAQQWNAEGWQTQIGKARPWKESRYDLEPKEGVSSFTDSQTIGFDMPPVHYGFGNLTGLPYYLMYANDGTKIPFQITVPEDFDELSETNVFFHVHFATEPYTPEGSQSTGLVRFTIDWIWADKQLECSSPITFSSSQNIISSCTGVYDLETTYPYYMTQLDDTADNLGITPKKNALIKGFISIHGDTDFAGGIIPLSIDIDYISNEFGVYDKRGGKK